MPNNQYEDHSIQSKKLETLAGLLKLLVLGISMLSMFIIVWARMSHASSERGLVIASKRDYSEDSLFQTVAKEQRNVVYVREGDPFYQTVTDYIVSKHPDAAKARLLVIGAVKKNGRFVAQDLLATDQQESMSVLAQYATAEAEPPLSALLLPTAVVAGLLFSGLFAKIPHFALFALAAILSGYQYYAHCPTCPDTMIASIPASFLGIAVFSLLSVLSLINFKSQVLKNICIICILSTVLLWQLYMNHVTLSACVPCIVIALVGGISAGNLPKNIPAYSRFFALAPVSGIIAACLLVLSRDSFAMRANAIAGFEGQIHDSAFEMQGVVGKPISELGITLPPQKTILAVVATGCEPCHDALEYLARRPDITVLVAETGPPSKDSSALRVPAGLWQQTPTFLMIGADGKIAGERVGWSDDPGWQDAFARESKQFLSGPENVSDKREKR